MSKSKKKKMEDVMFRKIWLVIVILIMVTIGLFAEKSLERLANELGVDGETKYNNKEYLDAGIAFENAISKLKEATEKEEIPLDSEKINRWYKLAFNSYFGAKDFENALRIQNMRIEKDPSNYELVNYKFIILKKYLKQPQTAIDVLEKFNAQKGSYKVEKKIASTYLKIKDYENALLWYRKAYVRKQSSSVIKNIAVILNQYLGRNKEAVKAYEDFIMTNPKEAELVKTYKNIGKLYEDMKNFTKAIEYYEKSNELSYDNDITLLLITKYFDRENYASALEKIELLLKNKPGNNDATYYRALIKYKQGNKIESKEDFQKLLDTKYKKEATGYIESIESGE